MSVCYLYVSVCVTVCGCEYFCVCMSLRPRVHRSVALVPISSPREPRHVPFCRVGLTPKSNGLTVQRNVRLSSTLFSFFILIHIFSNFHPSPRNFLNKQLHFRPPQIFKNRSNLASNCRASNRKLLATIELSIRNYFSNFRQFFQFLLVFHTFEPKIVK